MTKQIEEFTDVYSFLFWQLGGENRASLVLASRWQRSWLPYPFAENVEGCGPWQ